MHPDIVAALAEVGITRTFAIQELTLPLALAGHDLIGQARTGTGKTLGFGVPMLQRVAPARPRAATASRRRWSSSPPASCACRSPATSPPPARPRASACRPSTAAARSSRRSRRCSNGVEIVVGTPGRLLDLAQQGHLILGKVRMLVLDEADEMLDLGFLPDIERILGMVPDKRQTMLFSATMPGPIVTLSRPFMTQPTHIRAEEPTRADGPADRRSSSTGRTTWTSPSCSPASCRPATAAWSMVFCRTKRTAQKVADELVDRGFAAAAVHGDLGQGAREQALRAFRAGKVDVLVATDVAARGIDVTGVTPRRELPVPRGREDLPAPHRPHRPGRRAAASRSRSSTGTTSPAGS